MLPLGLISVYQTRAVVSDARALSSAALMARTVAAASEERKLIESALGAAEGLAAVVPTLNATNCSDILQGFVEQNPRYIFAGFIATDGLMSCSSTGATRDFSQTETFQTALERPEPRVSVNPSGAVTGAHVILATYPARNGDRLVGFMTLSIPHAKANAVFQDPGPEDGLKLASFSLAGDLIAASDSTRETPGFLPRDINPEELVERSGRTFRATSLDGEDRIYAVTLTVKDTLLLVGSWPSRTLPAEQSHLQGTVATVLPFLMWLAGVGVALIGIERLVTRHVANLRSAMRQFALGDRTVGALVLHNAPVELEEAGRAFNRMALLIADAETQRGKDLKDKEVLLREVHHRVKNNLQLIASIISMQIRKTGSDEVRRVLARLQQRVRGMAVLHRTLYNTPVSSAVEAAEVINAVVEDWRRGDREDRLPEIQLELADMALFPDQAIALSLLTAELLSSWPDVRLPSGARAPMVVTLRDDGQGALSLTMLQKGNHVTQQAEDYLDTLGLQLVEAFTRQLDAHRSSRQTQDGYETVISFQRSDFSG